MRTQQETDEENEEEEGETNGKGNYENQTMPICDETTQTKGKDPKIGTNEEENEETDNEQKKRNNIKRTDALGEKEGKKPIRTKEAKMMDT